MPTNMVILYLFTGAEYKIYSFPTRYLRREAEECKGFYYKNGRSEYVGKQNQEIQENGQVIVFTGNCRSCVHA